MPGDYSEFSPVSFSPQTQELVFGAETLSLFAAVKCLTVGDSSERFDTVIHGKLGQNDVFQIAAGSETRNA